MKISKNWLQEIKSLFLPLWKSRLFKYMVLLNFLMLIVAIIVNYSGVLEPGGNDFRVYYASGIIFRNDLLTLYDTTQNYFRPFRYFPLGAFFFSFITYLPQNWSNILFWVISFIVTIINTHLLYYILIKIYRIPESHYDQVRTMVSVFLFYVPHYENYQMAQNNAFLLFYILFALIFLQKSGGTKIRWLNPTDNSAKDTKYILKMNILGGISLGMAANIKPIALVFVPFILLVKIQNKKIALDFRQTIIRLIGVAIPLIPNLVLFLIYPRLMQDFITVNFSGSDELVDSLSVSLVRQFVNIAEISSYPNSSTVPSILIMLLIFIPLYIIGWGLYLFRPKDQDNLAIYFTIAFTIFMIGYFDTWGHDLTVWGGIALIALFPFRIIYYPTGLPPKEGPNLYFKFHLMWCFLGGLFWTGVYYLTKDMFYAGSPGFNPIHSIFMIIFFISMVRVMIQKIKQQQPL